MGSQLDLRDKKPCTTKVIKRRANKTKKDLLPEDLQAFIVQDRAADPDRGFVARRARSGELSDGESDVKTSRKVRRARGKRSVFMSVWVTLTMTDKARRE